MFRRITAAVLIIVATILAPFAVGALWIQQTVMNEQKFVETIAPLTDDPQVQQTVATEATNAILAQLNTEERLQQALADRAGPVASILDTPVLLEAISSGINSAVTTGVNNYVHSDRFGVLWTAVAQEVQKGFVQLVNRDPATAALKLQDDQLVLNTGIAVEKIRAELVDRGVPFADKVDVPGRDIVVADAPNLQTLADALRLFLPVASWLWLVVLLMFALGVFLWRPRARGLMWAGLGFLLAGGLAFAGLELGQTIAVDSVPAAFAGVTSSVAALLLRFMATALASMIVIGLALLIGGWMAGGTRSGRAVRDRVRGFAHRWGEAMSEGWLGRFTSGHQMFVPTLRAIVLAGAVGILFAVGQLTPQTVLWTAIGAGIMLLLVEVVEGAGRGYEEGRSGAVLAAAGGPGSPDNAPG